MFDFRDYTEYRTLRDLDIKTEVGDIDEDLSADIDNLLLNRFSRLYRTDRFRRGAYSVDIVHPVLTYPGARTLVKGPNHLRFLLSLYPYAADLENVDKIVIRPRHVELSDVEIMALYLRRRKILVLYLHHPFFYDIEGSKFRDYSEFKPLNLSQLSNTQLIVKPVEGEAPHHKVPPLWYVLSIISHEEDDRVDKFLLKRAETPDPRIAEISFFYSRHGY